MGADVFETQSTGDNVELAFQYAVADAAYWNGHGGYTGTIAEKDSYVLFTPPDGVDVETVLTALSNSFDRYVEGRTIKAEAPDWAPANWYQIVDTYNDKWGPCVAIPNGENTWVFAGWASC